MYLPRLIEATSDLFSLKLMPDQMFLVFLSRQKKLLGYSEQNAILKHQNGKMFDRVTLFIKRVS